MKRLLVAGCGDLGIRLAARLPSAEWQTSGLRRRVERLPASIRPVAADLLDLSSLAAVDPDWDAIVYQATPAERSASAYRATYLTGLEHLLARVRTRRLIYVSSTAVFGEDGGGWVDESSPTDPAAFNGRILLEGEARARSAGGIVVRFSGIYGPGREVLIRQLRAGQARCRREPPQWTNRIHADDCAGVLAHLLGLADPAPVWCASDDRPATRCELLDWLAERLDLAGPADDRDLAGGQGKRVANAQLRASGYDFDYPDFRTGYGALLP